MDIALEEKGIAVSHPKKTRQTVDTVPESYLKYAGIYGYSTGVAKLSFPENKLLMIETLTDDSRQCVQYMYTTDGDFVNVTGDVLSGNAIVSTPLDVVTFAEEDGKAVSSVQMAVIRSLTHNVRPFAVIENVVTHDGYRKRGYASALLQKATEIAKDHNCYKVFLETGSNRESTLNFYRQNGFAIDEKHSCLKHLE